MVSEQKLCFFYFIPTVLIFKSCFTFQLITHGYFIFNFVFRKQSKKRETDRISNEQTVGKYLKSRLVEWSISTAVSRKM